MDILIVDDEEDIGTLISRRLSRSNYQCTIANNLSEAKKQLNKEQFNHIFLDINLPDGNGFDLFEKINALDYNPSVTIISAYEVSKEIKELRTDSDVSYLKKPFTLLEIEEITPKINE